MSNVLLVDMWNVIVLDWCDYTFDIYDVVVIGVWEHVRCIVSRCQMY